MYNVRVAKTKSRLPVRSREFLPEGRAVKDMFPLEKDVQFLLVIGYDGVRK